MGWGVLWARTIRLPIRGRRRLARPVSVAMAHGDEGQLDLFLPLLHCFWPSRESGFVCCGTLP